MARPLHGPRPYGGRKLRSAPARFMHYCGYPSQERRMKHLRMVGLVIAAAFCAAQANAEELTGTLKKIKETGAITIGYRDSSIPFSYLDDNQKPIGFAIDICLAIVDAVKKDLKLDKLAVECNPVTTWTRIPSLANGTSSPECGSTPYTADRLT